MQNYYGNSNDTVVLTANGHEVKHLDAPLELDQIPSILPQHLNHTAAKGRTEKYDLFESDTIIRNLQEQGFVVRDAIRQKSRHEEDGGVLTSRHLYRLCKKEDFSKEEIPELVLVNSHNGSCSLKVYTGFFRLICENGVIAGGEEALSIRHMGHTMEEVLASIHGVADNFSNTYGMIDTFKTRLLNGDEINQFAIEADKIRPAIGLRKLANPMELVNPRRHEDEGNDLWSVFNRVQENMMKGGLTPLGFEGQKRRRLTRPIRNIVQNVHANRKLWQIAEAYVVG